MDDAYAARYSDLYARHWWWRAREQFVVDFLRKQFPDQHDMDILDVGCGDGLFFDCLQEFGQPEGIEPTSNMLSGRPKSGKIYECKLDEQFNPGKQYDLILMLDVLEHIEDDVAFLRLGKQLLNPEGRLLVTVPAFNTIWTAHDDLNHHLRRYTKRMFSDAASRAGINILLACYFDQWTFAAKLLVRLKEIILTSKPGPPEVPPSWINTGLIAISRLEHKTIGRLRMGFGSSLIVLAN